jgi:hypothetical protein
MIPILRNKKKMRILSFLVTMLMVVTITETTKRRSPSQPVEDLAMQWAEDNSLSR